MTWKKIDRSELAEWNKRLSRTDAHLFQYPMWNEPFGKMFFRSLYLLQEKNNLAKSYLAILSLGFGPFKIGLIQRGPILISEKTLDSEDLLKLKKFLRWKGFIFVRLTCQNPEILSAAKSLKSTIEKESFPFYRDLRQELVINYDSINEVFNSFTGRCRYKIRRAEKAGYIVKHTTSIEELKLIWPLFQKIAELKGFKRRPLRSFISLFQCSENTGFVRLFSVYYENRLVAARIMVRDKVTVFSLSSALDRVAIYKNISPGLLLHWEAMRYYFSKGVKVYNFGTRSGTVYEFKNSFHPKEIINPEPVTMVINPFLFQLWDRFALKAFFNTIYKLKKLVR